MPFRRRSLVLVALAAALPLAATGGAPAQAAAGTVTLVAAGLDNPRSVAFGSNGHLYVADAGRGGNECPSQATGPEGQQCAGLTGALVRVANGQHEVIVSGFVSVASPGGAGASGLAGLTRQGSGFLGVIGLSSQQVPPGFSGATHAALVENLGHLVQLDLGTRRSQLLADPGTTDWNWTTAHKDRAPGNFPDANPYAVIVGPDGRTVVVDAASNTVDSVWQGNVTPRRYIPNFGTGDAVPTCIAIGPDRALYVGTLGAAGNSPGASSVYRIAPGQPVTAWRTGFTTITGCGFDRSGNFYATELQTSGFNPGPKGDPHGAVVKVSADGRTRTMLGVGSLFYPQSFALAPDGNSIYLSNWSILPGTPSQPGGPTGSVVRLSI